MAARGPPHRWGQAHGRVSSPKPPVRSRPRIQVDRQHISASTRAGKRRPPRYAPLNDGNRVALEGGGSGSAHVRHSDNVAILPNCWSRRSCHLLAQESTPVCQEQPTSLHEPETRPRSRSCTEGRACSQSASRPRNETALFDGGRSAARRRLPPGTW